VCLVDGQEGEAAVAVQRPERLHEVAARERLCREGTLGMMVMMMMIR
jgi:hypothetical protein